MFFPKDFKPRFQSILIYPESGILMPQAAAVIRVRLKPDGEGPFELFLQVHTPGTAYYEALCDELAAGEFENSVFRGKSLNTAGNAAGGNESARASTNRSASGRSSVSLSTVATSAWALETHSAGLRQ